MRWTKEVKEEAAKWRKEGASYGEIGKRLGVAKSTLSYWMREVGYPEEYWENRRRIWLLKIQPLGAEANRKKKKLRVEEISSKVNSELDKLNLELLLKKALLSAFYWAEGSKGVGSLIFANTDPQMMRLFVIMLRDSLEIDESKLRVRVHIHDYQAEDKIKNFWSEVLSVPLSQFQKTQIKARSLNKTIKKNEWGVCFLIYHNSQVREELMFFARGLGEKLGSPLPKGEEKW